MSALSLTQIDVPIWLIEGSVDIGLYSDSSGLSGSLLESWTLTTSGAPNICCAVDTVAPSASIILNDGTQYWLVASPTAGNSAAFAVWDGNNIGQTGPVEENGFASTNTERAFDVLGTSTVPEPASALLAACGAMLLGLAARRRRRAN